MIFFYSISWISDHFGAWSAILEPSLHDGKPQYFWSFSNFRKPGFRIIQTKLVGNVYFPTVCCLNWLPTQILPNTTRSYEFWVLWNLEIFENFSFRSCRAPNAFIYKGNPLFTKETLYDLAQMLDDKECEGGILFICIWATFECSRTPL